MTKTRNRKRPTLSLQERLKRSSDQARAAARTLPKGKERDLQTQKEMETNTAANIDLWLSTGLQRPK
jgi:hypothetical protein